MPTTHWGTRPLVLFDDPAFDEHDPGDFHPECTARLPAIREGLAGHPWEVVRPRPATRQELLRVHTQEHIAEIEHCDGKWVDLDADTHTSPGSTRAAFLAAGAAVEAAEIVAKGGYAYVLCRPPGHHATPHRAMGFCLFNNAAVAAAHLVALGKRVAIIDPDVHHGNGTQDAFYERADVLYSSLHRFPFYPGTGRAEEMGRGPGLGFTLNVPLPGGIDERVWLTAFRRLVLPALERFKPDACVLSTGFDCLEGDLLGGMEIAPQAMAVLVGTVATRWPTMAVLEGGYTVENLGYEVRLAATALAGAPLPELDETPPSWFDAMLYKWRHPLLA